MEIKNEILYRVYILLFGVMVPVAGVLVWQTISIGIFEGERWREKGENLYVDIRPVKAERGNIFAEDDRLLATSIPYFDIFMDPNSTGMTEEFFLENVDTLAYCLATYVDQSYTVGGMRNRLLEERAKGTQYLPIKRKVSFSEKKRIENFPVFNKGQYGGGFIAQKHSERKRPFNILAQRTIGYVREGAKPVGLEGYFDEVLSGEEGQQPMIRVDRKNDIWLPISNLSKITPKTLKKS